MEKICKGCGAKLQTERPADYGYVLAHLLEKEFVLCRRCHRISHYGRDEVGPVTAEQSLRSIREGVRWADGVVLVVDLMDFEAGFPPELLDLVQNRDLLIAVNKMDLLPKQTPPWEVERWVRRRLKSLGLPGVGLELISALNGYGFPKLADRLSGFGPRVLFAGVVNVGKSNVISRLLKMRIGGRRRDYKPTVSAYPGTTVEYSRWQCPNGLVLADSPGYVAGGRLSELVCPECGRQLAPDKPLAGKLQPIKPGELLAVFGLAAVECLKGDGLLLGYSAAALKWRKAKQEQVAQVLAPGHFHCAIEKWEQKEMSLAQFEDLVITGLGWVSARKSAYRLRVHYPAGVRVLKRPNLIGPKK
ncbi:MAG TPA: hypothetical protein GX528_01270 [Firmicutes bacterium]|nr:hypothetical protein [Bacillota bacterium]